MTTSAKNPNPPNPTGDNLMLMVGQLLEATKAASEGLKSISREVQRNSKAIAAAANTLETLSQNVDQLDNLVQSSTNDNNLIAVTKKLNDEIAAYRGDIETITRTITELRMQVSTITDAYARNNAVSEYSQNLIKFVGWAIATAIACWAAYAQGQK